jgi:hypothetical protein
MLLVTYTTSRLELFRRVRIQLHVAVFVIVHLQNAKRNLIHKLALAVPSNTSHLNLNGALDLHFAADRAVVHRAPTSIPAKFQDHKQPTVRVLRGVLLLYQKLLGLYFDD